MNTRRLLVLSLLLCSAFALFADRSFLQAKAADAPPVKVPPRPLQSNLCNGKKNFSHLGIPRNAPSSITHAVSKGGVVLCTTAKPTGSCHIQLLGGAAKDLNPNDSMGIDEDHQTITFSCSNGATSCFLNICD